MQFDLIRLVLVSRAQTSLFERRAKSGDPLTREEWLRQIFSNTIEFKHAKNDFHYIPDIQADKSTDLLVGRIGRQFKAVENLSPDEGFKEVERAPWRASSVFIDPKHHDDGQKLGFEVKDHIGGSLPIIKSLSKHINEANDEPYIIEANSIVDPKTFWDFEKANRGNITSITFDLVAPNMFGIRDEMDSEMQKFRENEKARSVSLTLKNQDGLRLSDKRVEESVKYATEGGGAIIARTKGRRKTFNSNKNGKRESVVLPENIDRNVISNIVGFVKAAIFGAKNE